jgi:pSer/pThr/pTyr-binding forkhead associated (FHA) protein
MATRVLLTGTEGTLTGKKYTFDGPGTCAVGRAADCDWQVPSEEALRIVSRHHCLLIVDSSDVSICDCGSRNGTFVNGTRIDMLDDHVLEPAGRPLHAGDEVRLGNVAFRVDICHEGEKWLDGQAVEDCALCACL